MRKEVQQRLLELVKRNYEEIAEDYDRTRRKHSDPLFTELKKHAQRVQKGDKVLDAGCGNGRLLELLPEQVEYLGVDSSEKLIKICRERFSSYRFRVMDILNLKELEEKEFDHIFSVAVLHQIPGKEWRVEALKQMKKKLEREGRIVITVWNLWVQKKMRKRLLRFSLLKLLGKNKMDWKDVLFDWKKGDRTSQRYYHAFTRRELKRTIKQAGLNWEEISKDGYNYFAVLKRK